MLLFLTFDGKVTKAFSETIEKHHLTKYQFKNKERSYQIAYANATSGITIALEVANVSMWSIFIHRLINGNIIHHPLGPYSSPLVHTYDLLDILTVKNANSEEIEVIKCYFPSKSNEIAASLSVLPGLVEKFAGEILDGHFSIYSDLLELEKNRIKNHSWLSPADIKSRSFL
jgi:hypothetical protein